MYFDSGNMTPDSGSLTINPKVSLYKDDPYYRYCARTQQPHQPLQDPWRRGIHQDREQTHPAVHVPDGRFVAWSNAVPHRIAKFHRADRTKPGRRRFIKLHLVDSSCRICSTRNVPPQQPEWHVWRAIGLMPWGRWNVSPEIQDLIAQCLRRLCEEDGSDWPMSRKDALELCSIEQTIYSEWQYRLERGRVYWNQG